MPKHYLLEVANVHRDTADAISIYFHQPKLERIQYKPGQYLTLKVEIDQRFYYRSYSMFTTQRLDEQLAIMVKRVPKGVVSSYLHEHVKVGMRLEVIEPAGSFFLVNTVKDIRTIVLIGAGSGITPLMAMLRSTLFDAPRSKVLFIYANRNEASIIFRSELEKLSDIFSHRFKLLHILSQAEPGLSLDHKKGRITSDNIMSYLAELGFDKTNPHKIFLCAPEELMDFAQKALIQAEIKEQHIFREAYHSPAKHILEGIEQEGIQTRKVSINTKVGMKEVTVPAGMSILDAGLEAGVDIPHSCRTGECLTCMAVLEKGKVRMRDKNALTEQDYDRGYRLLCQSFPLDGEVELNIEEG